MQIIYVNSDRTPSEGDVKILKDGTKFVRYQERHDGCRLVLRNGDPMFDWRRDPNAPIPTTPQRPKGPKPRSLTFRFKDTPADRARANALISALSGQPFPK